MSNVSVNLGVVGVPGQSFTNSGLFESGRWFFIKSF